MTDDGIGLAALAKMRAGWELDPGVELVDGGMWALSLLPQVEDAGGLLLLDAIDGGGSPGSVIELEGREIPLFLGTRLSPHQMGVRDLLALCALRGTLPERTAALGIQPAVIELGTTLSPPAEAALDPLLERVARRLREWGWTATRRREAALAHA
jgi:hydrogenase maturation protease